MHYTISQDHTGGQDAVARARLAVLVDCGAYARTQLGAKGTLNQDLDRASSTADEGWDDFDSADHEDGFLDDLNAVRSTNSSHGRRKPSTKTPVNVSSSGSSNTDAFSHVTVAASDESAERARVLEESSIYRGTQFVPDSVDMLASQKAKSVRHVDDASYKARSPTLTEERDHYFHKVRDICDFILSRQQEDPNMEHEQNRVLREIQMILDTGPENGIKYYPVNFAKNTDTEQTLVQDN